MTALGPLHPQIQALVSGVEVEARLGDGRVSFAQLRLEYAQTAERRGGPRADMAQVSDEVMSGVPVRVYVPHDAATGGTVVYAHGGGWVSGDLEGIDRVCRALAAGSASRVVSVDYRLAPEHPFPAPLDDVCSVVESAVGGSGTVAVAGDSAGANLVAAAALRRRDEVSAQMLVYPALDATLSGESYALSDPEYALSRGDMSAAYSAYAGDADPSDPAISPLLAEDLTGAPPALIVVASHDVLRADGERYAQRLREAGVEARLDLAEGMIHGFLRWGGVVAEANVVLESGGAWLAERLRF